MVVVEDSRRGRSFSGCRIRRDESVTARDADAANEFQARSPSSPPFMAAFFFASPIDVDVKLEGEELRKQIEIKSDKDKTISCPVYYDGESVAGQVRAAICVAPMPFMRLQVAIRVRDGKKLAHDGIKVEFVGSIGPLYLLASSTQTHSNRAILRPRSPS